MIFAPNLRWWLIAIALISIAVVISVNRAPQRQPQLAPLVANTSAIAVAPRPSVAMELGAAETLHVIVAPQALPDSVSHETIVAELNTALAYVSARTATVLAAPITVKIDANPQCALHGVAYTTIREVQVFTCTALPLTRAVNILAHEFVHQLAHDHYGDAHLSSDPILLEGWATWGAGRYWLGRYASFRAFLGGQAPLPLITSHLGRPAAEMNTLYYQWASFVEYLLIRDGRDAFDRLYRSGRGTVGSADYQGVYGVDLATLEAEWRIWLTEER